VQLRIAGNADIGHLMDLINSAFRQAESFIIDRDRVDLEVVQSLLEKGKFLVAEDEGSLAGCVHLELRGERAYLGLLSVDPRLQKSGVGSLLLREAELHCARAGCRFMDLRIIDLRQDNHAFYKRRGYVETGTEPFPPELTTKLPCHFVTMSKPLA